MPSAPEPAVEPARITLRGVALSSVVWTLYGVGYGVAVALFAGVPLGRALSGQVLFAAILAVTSVVPWWVIVRGMAEARLGARAAAHAVGAVLYVAVALAVLLLWVRAGGEEAYRGVAAQAGWIGVSALLAYVAQFAVYHGAEAARRARARRGQAEALRHLAREQELRTLRSQLNPHFLFNALTAISADVTRDPEAARESLGRLASLLRYALDAGHRDTVPLADELQFTRDYLALEQARMGSRLAVHYDIDDRALQSDVPPMAIQTLAENAVRHGLAPRQAGGDVRVSVARRGAQVDVRVDDTGVGAPAEASGGIGLANTSERLHLLFGPGATLTVDAERPVGFGVSFSIPASP